MVACFGTRSVIGKVSRMDLQRWRQIRSLSEAAAELRPKRRHAWLLSACDDEELRSKR